MRKNEHFLLLTWVLTTSLVAVGAVISWELGLIQDLIETDRSRVCILLIAMYVVGLGHAFQQTRQLSRELDAAHRSEQLLAAGGSLRLEADGVLVTGGHPLPAGFLSDYLRDLFRAKRGEGRGVDEAREKGDDILEAYAARLRGRYEFGWFMVDLMLKVGFLGTLVGFIWMLGSVSGAEVVDASSMQNILSDMSYGMSTALNATLASLVTGTLLSFPYYLLGRGLEELLESTVRVTQVEVLPRLARA